MASPVPMGGPPRPQGEFVTTLSRWGSLALGLLALGLLWNSPGTHPVPALWIALGWATFAVAARIALRHRPHDRRIRVVHDLVDAATVAGGAAVSGGLASPIWLLLYPHVVAVSVRGGLRYALSLGLIDALLLLGLAVLTPTQPAGPLHALGILFCAFMGGTASSHLKQVRARLAEANASLATRNAQLSALVEVGQGILERVELGETLPLVTRSLNELMGTHYCVLLLCDGDRLELTAQEGLEQEIVLAWSSLRVGESLSGWVALHGEALAVEDMSADPRTRNADIVQKFGYRSYLCVPLRRAGEVLGTLEVVTKDLRRFDATEQEVMAAFAGLVGVAIDNARLLAQTRSHLARLRDANQRLEALDRLRKQYLRNVSHEFRTPLTVIRGYAEYVGDAGGLDEGTLQAVMRTIMESCERVIDMVDTLIEVSRVEQADAHETLQLRSLELEPVVHAALEPLRAIADKKGVGLDVEFPDGRLPLAGDEDLLRQLVRKLVDNAVKFSQSGTRTTIRGRAEDDCVVLEVIDAGIGIPPEHHERVFEKFYMIEGGIDRRAGGTGVGLYLAREVARLHGGSLDLDSRPGQGSRFVARLPRRTPQAARVG